MKNLTTQTWIRIALGAIALAMVLFANYDVATAIGVVIAVYEFIGYKKDEKHEKDLVNFGNYMLSRKRATSTSSINQENVTDADIFNYKNQKE